jgi:predicted nucleotidyltransferase component of viral defense system
MNALKNMLNQYKSSKITEQTKIREILQQTALLGLERQGFFEKAAFYGGTALRILYGLDRFSEDLDFTLLKPDPQFDFAPFLEGMRKELASFGFEMEVSTKQKNVETSVISAFMKANTLKLYLAIGNENKSFNHNEKIQIKLEVDIDPPTQFRIENHLVTNPIAFYVLTLHKNDLFGGKMHAVLHRAWKGRVKGRDWYDLIWYIQNKVPLGLRYLEACLHQSGHLGKGEILTRDKIVEMLRIKIEQIDWISARADMDSFIADPERLRIWSPQFFLSLINHLIVE